MLAVLGLLAAGCAGGGAEQDQPAVQQGASECGADSQEEWDELVAAAQEEGTVVTSGPPTTEVREQLPAAFSERFGIEVKYLGGRSSELAAKLRSERQAGIYSQDVFIGGADTMANVAYAEGWLDNLREAMVGETISDTENWVGGEMPFKDPEGQHIAAMSEYAPPMLVVNTDLVQEGEVTGWHDLLDPKWKGKMVADDPRQSGGGANDIGLLLEEFDEGFVVDLYQGQQVALLEDYRQEIDGLVRGRWAIGISMLNSGVDEAIEEGLPLKVITPDDARPQKTSGFGLLALVDKAPHPNAARLFANWLMCAEGNRVWNEAADIVSTRADVDTGASDYARIKPDLQYWDSYDWEFVTKGKQDAKERMKELFSD